jgi:hypothetical protein
VSDVDKRIDEILRSHVYALSQEIKNPTPQKGNEVYTKPTIEKIKALMDEVRIDEHNKLVNIAHYTVHSDEDLLRFVKETHKRLAQLKTKGDK